MSTRRDRWNKLAKSKKYREEFVAAQVKRGIPFQIRTLLKQKGLSQQELATKAKIAQGVVSRAADPEYGNLTLNTIIRVAAGFDIAFLGKFVPFSELDDWFGNLSEQAEVKTFDEENAEQVEPIPPQSRRLPAAGAADSYRQPCNPFDQFEVIEGGAKNCASYTPLPTRNALGAARIGA